LTSLSVSPRASLPSKELKRAFFLILIFTLPLHLLTFKIYVNKCRHRASVVIHQTRISSRTTSDKHLKAFPVPITDRIDGPKTLLPVCGRDRQWLVMGSILRPFSADCGNSLTKLFLCDILSLRLTTILSQYENLTLRIIGSAFLLFTYYRWKHRHSTGWISDPRF